MDPALDKLDDFCGYPASEFWRRSGKEIEPSNTTWHDIVDFTECFEDTAILYGITVFFMFFASVRLICGNENKPSVPFNLLNVTKILLCIIIILPAVADLIYTIVQSTNEIVAHYQFLSPIVLALTMLLSVPVIYFERRVGIRSSGLMTLLWLLLTVYGGIKLRTLILIWRDVDEITDEFRFVTFCIEFLVFIIQLCLVLIPEPSSPYDTFRSEREPCPEESATFLSRITWWWQNSLFWRGFRRDLVYEDLCDLNYGDKSHMVAPKFQKQWNRQLRIAGITFQRTNQGNEVGVVNPSCYRSPSIVLSIAYSFGFPFFVAGLFKLGQDLLAFVSPQILKLMINYVSDENEAEWKGYLYAALMFGAAVLQSLLLHQFFHRGFQTGMRVRTAVIAAVYRKALLLSNSARRTSTVGEIVNLMSVDAQRLMDVAPYLHTLWSAPLQIVLSLVFLYEAMGPSVFAGFGVMVLLIPINAVIATINRRLQIKQMTKKDSRIKLMNEVLNGIRVIKLYAWEIPFKRMIMGIRGEELNVLKTSAVLNAATSFTWTCAPFLVALATFATYVLIGEKLTAEKAFVALSLFNILRFPLIMLPMMITFIVQASVSVKRLSAFLQNGELDLESTSRRDEPANDGEDSVSVLNGTFTWDEINRPCLNNINLTIKPGELVAVVGQVGAGKSSLISALLGEMEKISGHVALRGRVAYVPQQAWIQNATVKDNIQFGKPLNGTLYDRTIKACALEPDFEILPGGDMTEIGEKGINLSGGQKQRVSLARAVYQESDIYLLDDPLSAVDSHVGKHIFDNVIGPDGMLKGKVRLLVTHNINILPRCNKILVISNGQITEEGTYSLLITQEGSRFAEFLQSYSNVRETDEANDTGLTEETVPTDTTTNDNNKQDPNDSSSGKPVPANLVMEESVELGNVKSTVILTYIKACTYTFTFFAIFFYTLFVGASIGQNFWLAHWSNAESANPNRTDLPEELGVYSVLGGAQILFMLLATLVLVSGVIVGSRTLHDNMLSNILRSPMSFFDTTPLGRILNRFSKDIDSIDEKIPSSLQDFLLTLTEVFAILIVISVTSPWFLIVIVPLAILYFLIQRFYTATSRQLNRLQSVSRSPIFSHFRESVTGASSIRAYGHTERFIGTSKQLVDDNNIAYYPIICSKRWLATRLELIGNLVILFAALFAVLQRDYSNIFGRINAGLAGLSIGYAIEITQSLNWFVRMSSELESDIVAVERTKEYSEMPTEAAEVCELRPPDDWPNTGRIQFDRYSTKYRTDLNLVLKDVSGNISAGEKVGIVGRTGAGKSSLTLALFRIIESVHGAIIIDGIDIATIGLRDLRSRITIIPQDPVLFSGTLRINLDPFDSHTDDEIWFALQTAHLSQFVNGLDDGLEHSIAEGGENISVGQRQLVCLARALLRKTKILVLDEATAAVDMETDDLIQKTIRREFADATVITIAHRLNTIMDYDSVIVLDNGHVVEFNSPKKLLEQKGHFYQMAQDAHLVS